VKARQAEHCVVTLCRVLGLSRSGYYAWLHRDRCARARQDEQLLAMVREEHLASKGIYGAPRIHARLKRRGMQVSRKRVARLMQQASLVGVTRRRWKAKTTVRDKSRRPAPDLVQRRFVADHPNQLWVADITHIPLQAGTLFLAMILDACSRKVVGFATDTQMPTELVLTALERAVAARQPQNVVHHSDQGSQYTSLAFTSRCRALDIRVSMGSVGDCFDNAMAESFFATLETELLALVGPFPSRSVAESQIFSFIEGFYNTRRLHSALGQRSPCELNESPPSPHPFRERGDRLCPRCDTVNPISPVSTESGQLQSLGRQRLMASR
jgi:putative transposase